MAMLDHGVREREREREWIENVLEELENRFEKEVLGLKLIV